MADEWDQREEGRRLRERLVGRNQAEFARTHSIPGGASMVTQHIKGHRPIGLAAALAYAKAFGVPLREISPRHAAAAAAAAEMAGPNAPRNDFRDRREVDESDWATLQAVKVAMTATERADLLRRAEELRRQAKEQIDDIKR